jgi:hypothetical protein
MSSWHSYPSIYALGHRYVASLLDGPVIVEEKVDGSQFSFGVFEEVDPASMDALRYERVLKVRSKGCQLMPQAPEKMFTEAVQSAMARADLLHPGWTYRAEYLKKPKHNGLAYDRVPTGHLIIFDINTDLETYLSPAEKAAEAARIGLECVPVLREGLVADLNDFRSLLDTVSVLGGQKIEGVVVKPAGYDRFGLDKKVVMGKFVSEAFKEVQAAAWKESNPKSGDILLALGDTYTTQARWMKAVQHLRERGVLEDSPRDIGYLFEEVPADIKKECEEQIKAKLFAWAWPHISRMTTRGLAEWYKGELLKRQFEEKSC